MTPRLKTEAVPALMILASWLFVAHHWGRLPDQIPVHWGLSGTPDAFAPKVPGVFMIPAIGTMLTLTMMAWPAFAPRSSARETLLGVFQVLKVAISAFFCVLTYLVLQADVSPGHTLTMSAITTLVGILFVILGDRLPKIRPNGWLGIRTPWTLAHPEVWERTHRQMGKWFVFSGLLIVLATVSSARTQVVVLIVAVLGVSGGSLIVSISEYRKVQG